MGSKLTKTAAVAAAAAIAFSGAQGVAAAQSENGSLGSTSTGDATQGSIDTSGSAILGEPTLGSLAPVVGSVENNSSTTLKIDDLNGALLVGGGLTAAAAAAVAVGVSNGTIQLPEGFELPAGIEIPGL